MPLKGPETSLVKIDPDTLENRSGGGCVSLIGLFFLLPGIFIMQIPLGLVPLDTEGASLPWYFFVIFGLPFAAIGTVFVFGRYGFTIDRRRGVVREWKGLLVPMKRTETLLSLYECIRVRHQAGDKNSADTFPVEMAGPGVKKPLTIAFPTDYVEARRMAEELSRFLDKPLEDSSAAKKIVREPGRLDEPLRDRIRRTGEDVQMLPPMPQAMQAKILETVDGVTLELPVRVPVLFRMASLVVSFIMVSVVGFIAIPFINRLPFQTSTRFGLILLVAAIFMLGPIVTGLRLSRMQSGQRTIVTVNGAVLRVEQREGGKTAVREIPVDELEDLVLPTTRSIIEETEIPGQKYRPVPGDTGRPRMPDGRPVPGFFLSLLKLAGSQGITARSDKTTLTFGQGLPEAELVYIHGLIRKTITGP